MCKLTNRSDRENNLGNTAAVSLLHAYCECVLKKMLLFRFGGLSSRLFAKQRSLHQKLPAQNTRQEEQMKTIAGRQTAVNIFNECFFF